jgi:hypothetical protein
LAKGKSTGDGKLEDALGTLIQNQAALRVRMAESDQRFAIPANAKTIS